MPSFKIHYRLCLDMTMTDGKLLDTRFQRMRRTKKA
jgi:hypothetical protein